MTNELVEKIADFMHDQWSHWMRYVFSKGDLWDWSPDDVANDIEDFILPREFYDRWQKQMKTPYSELSEAEKESDREWARKLLQIIPKLTEDELRRGYHIYQKYKKSLPPKIVGDEIIPQWGDMEIEHVVKCPCNKDIRLKGGYIP